MKNFFKYIVLSACSLLSIHAMAQKSEKSNLDNAEVVIEKNSNYDLHIMGRDYDKIQRIEKRSKPSPQSYELELVEIELNDSLPTQLPAVLDDYEERTYYNNYVRIGYGNYITPYFEGGINSHQNPEYDYGINFMHLSSQEGSVSRKLSAGSRNTFDGFGKYYSDYGTSSVTLNYDRIGTHFYGFEGDETLIDKDSIKQVINTIGFKIGHVMPSYLTGNNYTVKGDLFFDYSFDRLDANELEIGLALEGDYELSEDARVNVKLTGAFNQYNNQTTTNVAINQNRSWMKFGGNYETRLEDWYIKAGVKLAYSGDSSSLDNNFYFYPDVFVEYTVEKDVLAAFLEVKGDLNLVNYQSLTHQNAWVSNDLMLLHENEIVDIRVGADANIGNDIGIRGSIGYAIVDNMGFFINDPNDISKFLMTYATENNTGVFNINAVGSWSQREWSVSASTDWNFYSIEDDFIETAYHRPLATNNLEVSYKYLSNWLFKANFYNKIGLKAMEVDEQTAETSTKSLPMIFDLNLSAHYKINENFDAFAQINNLFSQKYENYYRYNVKGFQLMAGVSYRF